MSFSGSGVLALLLAIKEQLAEMVGFIDSQLCVSFPYATLTLQINKSMYTLE